MRELAGQERTSDRGDPSDVVAAALAPRAAAVRWMVVSERFDPPPDLLEKVMTLVLDIAAQGWYANESGYLGVTRIAARALATIARASAARAPGVRAVLGRSSQIPRPPPPQRQPTATATVAPR